MAKVQSVDTNEPAHYESYTCVDIMTRKGIVTLELNTRELNPNEQYVIKELLPDLQDAFFQLLNKQAVLWAIV